MLKTSLRADSDVGIVDPKGSHSKWQIWAAGLSRVVTMWAEVSRCEVIWQSVLSLILTNRAEANLANSAATKVDIPAVTELDNKFSWTTSDRKKLQRLARCFLSKPATEVQQWHLAQPDTQIFFTECLRQLMTEQKHETSTSIDQQIYSWVYNTWGDFTYRN